MKNIFYRLNGNAYYKINKNNKKIIKIENNIVTTNIDFDSNVEEILKLKQCKLNMWKHIENSFFISRHFEWEFEGKKYRTTDKQIKWEKDNYGGLKSLVFHNGKIWEANNSANYYPRLFLTQVNQKYFTLNQILINKMSNSKWTDAKYCRPFEEIIE